MPSNSFEQKLRQRFEGAQIAPSPQVWGQLSRELAPAPARTRRMIPLIWWVMAACVVFLMGLFLGIRTSGPGEPSWAVQQQEPAGHLSQSQLPVQEEDCPENGMEQPEIFARDLPLSSPAGMSPLAPQAQAPWKHSPFNPGTVHGVLPASLSLVPEAAPPVFALDVEAQPKTLLLAVSNPNTAGPLPVTPLPFEGIAARPRRWAVGGSIHKGGQQLISPVTLEQRVSSDVLANPGNLTSSQVDLAGNVDFPPRYTGVSLFAEYHVRKGLSVQSGLGVHHFHHPLVIAASQRELSPGGLPDNPSYNNLSYSLLEFPLLVNYYAGQKRSALKISTGLVYQALLGRQPSLDYSYANALNANTMEETTQSLPVLQESLWRLQGKLQYQYRLGDRMALFGGPVFTYHLTPLLSQEAASPAWAAGLELGLKWYM